MSLHTIIVSGEMRAYNIRPNQLDLFVCICRFDNGDEGGTILFYILSAKTDEGADILWYFQFLTMKSGEGAMFYFITCQLVDEGCGHLLYYQRNLACARNADKGINLVWPY